MAGTACSRPGSAFDAALAGHHDVHQHDVRLLLDRLVDRPVGILGFPDRLDVGLRVEDAAQAAAHDGMVVDDDDPDRRRRARHGAIVASTRR